MKVLFYMTQLKKDRVRSQQVKSLTNTDEARKDMTE